MSGTTKSSAVPRAIVHKKILDAAEAEPDASIEKLAKTVNEASADLVEQVLDEYGDPVKETQTLDTESTAAQESHTDSKIDQKDRKSPSLEKGITSEKNANYEELTEKQEATLRAIYEDPEATQRELAKRFGVSSATICKRVNNIGGFEWEVREKFVEQIFKDNELKEGKQMTTNQATQDKSGQLDELQQRIQSIEEKLEGKSQARTAFDDPDLVHKVIHACMNSDQISEEEELRILEETLNK